MASVGNAELPDIYEATEAGKTLRQHERLGRDFDHLSTAIDLLPSSADETLSNPSFVYAPFLSLLLDAKSPRWEQVETALKSIFGSDRSAQELVAGRWAIGAVREVLGRAVPETEVEVAAARLWLTWLELSVVHTGKLVSSRQPGTTVPPVDNGASSGSQASVSNDRRNASVPASTQPARSHRASPITQDTHDRSSDSPLTSLSPHSRAQSLSVDPDLETTGQPFLLPGRQNASKRPRDGGVSPSSDSEQKIDPSPPAKKLNKGKGRAKETDGLTKDVDARSHQDKDKEETGDERSQVERRKTRASESHGLDEDEDSEPEEPVRPKKTRSTSKRRIVDEEEEDELDEVEIATGPSGSTINIDPHPQSNEERVVRSIFPSIPANINLSPSPTLIPTEAHVDRGFARPRKDFPPDMGGHKINMVSRGYTDGDPTYRQDTNHLCMTIDMNICSTPSGTRFRNEIFQAGQPVVVIGRGSKCQVILDGIIAKPGIGKTRSVINIWVNNDSVQVNGNKRSRWFYKGMYEVAYDGSKKGKGEYLPVPSGGGTSELHPELLKKTLVHVTGSHSEEVLPSWEFKTRDPKTAEAEIGTENTGGRRRHVKFIALRCVGWDHESWKIWTANRDAREAGGG